MFKYNNTKNLRRDIRYFRIPEDGYAPYLRMHNILKMQKETIFNVFLCR